MNNIDSDEINELLKPEVLERLRSQCPNAYYTVVEGDDGPVAVVFKRLTGDQVKRAQAMANDKARAPKMAASVFGDIVLHPEGEQLAALRDACPLIDDQVAALAMELARGQAPIEAKKLKASSGVRAGATRPSTGTA